MILSCNNTEKTFIHLRAQQSQINNKKCERRDGLASPYNSIIHLVQYAFAEWWNEWCLFNVQHIILVSFKTWNVARMHLYWILTSLCRMLLDIRCRWRGQTQFHKSKLTHLHVITTFNIISWLSLPATLQLLECNKESHNFYLCEMCCSLKRKEHIKSVLKFCLQITATQLSASKWNKAIDL